MVVRLKEVALDNSLSVRRRSNVTGVEYDFGSGENCAASIRLPSRFSWVEKLRHGTGVREAYVTLTRRNKAPAKRVDGAGELTFVPKLDLHRIGIKAAQIAELNH